MAKLTKLKIEKFRNVEPVELRFGEGFNVLLGLNATGKTTLLELIAAIMSDDLSAYAEEEFALGYGIALKGAELTVSVRSQPDTDELDGAPDAKNIIRLPDANVQPKWSAEVSLITVAGTQRVEYEASVGISGIIVRAPVLDYHEELQTQLSLRGFLLEVLHFIDFDREDVNPSITLDVWDYSDQKGTCRFDESLDYFRLITSVSSRDGRLRATPPRMILRRTRGSRSKPPNHRLGHRGVPYEIVSKTLNLLNKHYSEKGAELDELSIEADSLNFLRKAVGVLGLKTAHLSVRLLEKKVERGRDVSYFGDFRFMFERADGSIVSHDLLSYGQKRLLAFFYYLALVKDIVVVDEIVDGLHHRWIRECIDEIRGRQAFLASQNPLLFDYLEFESPRDVLSSFVLCKLEARDGGERMIWSNMSEYDAERFFEAYKVGIQHVSEILIDKGLW